MSPRDFELPAEALALIEEVRNLEARAQAAHTTLSAELERVRTAAERELAQTRREAVEQRREAESQIARARETMDTEREKVGHAAAELARDREALEALLESRVRGFEFIGEA